MEFTQFLLFDKEDGRGKNKMGGIFPYIQDYLSVVHLFSPAGTVKHVSVKNQKQAILIHNKTYSLYLLSLKYIFKRRIDLTCCISKNLI